MAIPVAPTITQTVTDSPVAIGAPVAELAAAEAETYALVSDTPPGSFAVSGSALTAAVELVAGSYTANVTATNVEGTSPEGTGSLTLADALPPEPPGGAWSDLGDDPNPSFPPIPPTHAEDEVPADAWKTFLVQATHMLRPHARDGVDYVVARATKYDPPENVEWNDVVLGPRPTAEIEALAQQLYANWPKNAPPPAARR
jgi:hypothetical protein